MQNRFLCILILVVAASASLQAQSVFGKWRTIDDKTGKPKAVFQIFEKDGKIHGKILNIFKESEKDKLCTACDGEKKNQPLIGLVILEDLIKDGNEYTDGTITNPDNGKTYDCKIWLDEENPNLLHVRGYFSFLYRTQTWERL